MNSVLPFSEVVVIDKSLLSSELSHVLLQVVEPEDNPPPLSPSFAATLNDNYAVILTMRSISTR